MYIDTLHSTDPDGDSVFYRLLGSPDSMTVFDSIIRWHSTDFDTGDNPVRAEAFDSFGGSDTVAWIVNVNRPPRFVSTRVTMKTVVGIDSAYIGNVEVGDSIDGDYAWFVENSDYCFHSVGTRLSNDFGLFDMLGNAAEWCNDWHSRSYYAVSRFEDPTGPVPEEANSYPVLRGGSYFLQELRNQVCDKNSREFGRGS
jgi:hypothetical protein